MTLLAALGGVLVLVGLGLIAVSFRFFALGMDAFYQEISFKKSIFKRY